MFVGIRGKWRARSCGPAPGPSTGQAPGGVSDQVPMELDQILAMLGQRGGGQQSGGEGNSGSETRTCYECGEVGHLSWKCPKRKKNFPRSRS